jgi:hypothetical protein
MLCTCVRPWPWLLSSSFFCPFSFISFPLFIVLLLPTERTSFGGCMLTSVGILHPINDGFY